MGGFDIYGMRILPDGYGDLERLDDTINTTADELDPVLGLVGFPRHLSFKTEHRGARKPVCNRRRARSIAM